MFDDLVLNIITPKLNTLLPASFQLLDPFLKESWNLVVQKVIYGTYDVIITAKMTSSFCFLQMREQVMI